jgi:hypothetical protein
MLKFNLGYTSEPSLAKIFPFVTTVPTELKNFLPVFWHVES